MSWLKGDSISKFFHECNSKRMKVSGILYLKMNGKIWGSYWVLVQYMYMVLQTNLHENKRKVTNLTKEDIGKKTVKKQSSINN